MDDSKNFETFTEARLYKKAQKKNKRKIKPLHILIIIALIAVMKLALPSPTETASTDSLSRSAGPRKNILII